MGDATAAMAATRRRRRSGSAAVAAAGSRQQLAGAADLAAAEEEPLAEGVGNGRIGVAEQDDLPRERDEKRRLTKKAREPQVQSYRCSVQFSFSFFLDSLRKLLSLFFVCSFFSFVIGEQPRAPLSVPPPLSCLLLREEREEESYSRALLHLSKEQVSFSKGRASGKEKRIKEGNKKTNASAGPLDAPSTHRRRLLGLLCCARAACGPGPSPGSRIALGSAPRSTAEEMAFRSLRLASSSGGSAQCSPSARAAAAPPSPRSPTARCRPRPRPLPPLPLPPRPSPSTCPLGSDAPAGLPPLRQSPRRNPRERKSLLSRRRSRSRACPRAARCCTGASRVPAAADGEGGGQGLEAPRGALEAQGHAQLQEPRPADARCWPPRRRRRREQQEEKGKPTSSSSVSSLLAASSQQRLTLSFPAAERASALVFVLKDVGTGDLALPSGRGQLRGAAAREGSQRGGRNAAAAAAKDEQAEKSPSSKSNSSSSSSSSFASLVDAELVSAWAYATWQAEGSPPRPQCAAAEAERAAAAQLRDLRLFGGSCRQQRKRRSGRSEGARRRPPPRRGLLLGLRGLLGLAPSTSGGGGGDDPVGRRPSQSARGPGRRRRLSALGGRRQARGRRLRRRGAAGASPRGCCGEGRASKACGGS